jgi:hypothetical protein
MYLVNKHLSFNPFLMLNRVLSLEDLEIAKLFSQKAPNLKKIIANFDGY